MRDQSIPVLDSTEIDARIRGEEPFGDVILKYGANGWYVKGHAKMGHFKTLPEIKEAIELFSIECILEQFVEDGIMERVS